MRLRLDRKTGTAKIIPETFDDLWTLHKVITPGSVVSARSVRKYKPQGSSREERIPVYVSLRAEKVEFHRETGHLRVTGPIEEIRPEDVASPGTYHTVDVEVGKEVSVTKEWKSYEINLLKEAVERSHKDLVHILLVDYDHALLATLRPYGVEFRNEFFNEKGKDERGERDTSSFFSLLRKVLSSLKGKILVGGPGFAKENFVASLPKDLASRVHLISSSNTEKSGVYEILKSDEFKRFLEEERVAHAYTVFESFLASLGRNDGRAVYGLADVKRAVEYGALQDMIVAEELLLNKKECEALVELAEKMGARVHLVPRESEDLHSKVMSFSGIIGVLRYRLDVS